VKLKPFNEPQKTEEIAENETIRRQSVISTLERAGEWNLVEGFTSAIADRWKRNWDTVST